MNILVVNTSGLGVGGITSNMINYIGVIRNRKPDWTFTVIVTGIRDESVVAKFRAMDCNVIFFPDRKKSLINYLIKIHNLLRNNSYDVVHVHGNSSTMFFELWLAKISCVKKRIAHCHNSKCNHPIFHRLLYPFFKKTYTDALSCSDSAGDWIFGKKNYKVLYNAIDLNKFVFDSKERYIYRKKLSIDKDSIVVGHIGVFNEQKNQEFVLKVFCELSEKINSHLILIGEGENKSCIENLALQHENSNIHFLGVRRDVEKWMSAMDIFIFPSKWEGLGMVAIEAEVSGLPVLASTNVPNSIKINENVIFRSLSDDVDIWCDDIKILIRESNSRNIELEKFEKYDINLQALELEKIYMSEGMI